MISAPLDVIGGGALAGGSAVMKSGTKAARRGDVNKSIRQEEEPCRKQLVDLVYVMQNPAAAAHLTPSAGGEGKMEGEAFTRTIGSPRRCLPTPAALQ